MNMVYAMGIGFLLDVVLGDSHKLPHPVRWIGRLIAILDSRLNRDGKKAQSAGKQICGGVFLMIVVLAVTGTAVWLLRRAAYGIAGAAGIAADGVMFYFAIAPRSPYRESMAVYRALPECDDAALSDRAAAGTEGGMEDCHDLEEARRRLSMIVGRDTACLDRAGIIRAAVETVAENTSDGVTAPILYMAVGGPVLCFLYKAANTMDSMIGYRDERYEFFGKAAARADDIWNYIPSRLTAWTMLLTAGFVFPEPRTVWKRGLSVYLRDRHNHKSPNAAQTESVCAGVLGIRLAGPASYFGQPVSKPYIGDALRPPQREDIRRAGRMMYASAVFILAAVMAVRGICT